MKAKALEIADRLDFIEYFLFRMQDGTPESHPDSYSVYSDYQRKYGDDFLEKNWVFKAMLNSHTLLNRINYLENFVQFLKSYEIIPEWVFDGSNAKFTLQLLENKFENRKKLLDELKAANAPKQIITDVSTSLHKLELEIAKLKKKTAAFDKNVNTYSNGRMRQKLYGKKLEIINS